MPQSTTPFQPLERESAYLSDSRRLTGPNLFFVSMGAVLEALGPAAKDAAAHTHWCAQVVAMARALGWRVADGHVEALVRVHAASTSLVLSAPVDQLFTATEVNEWAWETATALAFPGLGVSNAFGGAPNDVGDFDAALQRLRARSEAEKNTLLCALMTQARAHGAAVYVDEESVSIGSGVGACVTSLEDIDALKSVDWNEIRDVPIALVTGSNGKTTTVRLIAAMLKAHGLTPGYSSTEGVVIDGASVTSGDYSGPAGARTVLRDKRVECAVLETARGGMLRRGLAVARADVAVVTNVSADHFGEYGIDDLDDLTEAKLIVARAVERDGVLVMNGVVLNHLVATQIVNLFVLSQSKYKINLNDVSLPSHAFRQAQGERGHLENSISNSQDLATRFKHLWPKMAVFARDWRDDILQQKRAEGGSVCGVNAGRLQLFHRGETYDLGAINDMPLTMNGSAAYNIDNIAAASLAAVALGITPTTIANVLHTFGQTRFDNPGRLERWQIRGVNVLLDYAHNPDGLAGLLNVATGLKAAPGKRLGLLLGQAGNRENTDIEALAKIAASFAPDKIVLKDIDGMLRGREVGEVPKILRETLLMERFEMARVTTILAEVEAAKSLVEWSQPGDVVVLPMHGVAAKNTMRDWLDQQATCVVSE